MNEDDKPSAEHISVLKRFPKRLRSKVSLTLGGYSAESFDEEAKLQVRNVIAEIADVDVTQVNILSYKDPLQEDANNGGKDADGEEATGPKSGIDDAVDEFIELSSDSYISMDGFLQLGNASIVGIDIEFEIAAPSVAVAASIDTKFKEQLKKPDDLLAMFKGSGLKHVTQVKIDFKLAQVVSATGATGATGASDDLSDKT